MPKLIHIPDQPAQVEAFVSVLGRPGPLAVLRHLTHHGPSYRREIVAATGLAAPTVTTYLATLERHGVITAHPDTVNGPPELRPDGPTARRGRTLRYEVRSGVIRQLTRSLEDYLES